MHTFSKQTLVIGDANEITYIVTSKLHSENGITMKIKIALHIVPEEPT